jgi:outer membrane protein OmpA-like peptidoglycan-associated protein
MFVLMLALGVSAWALDGENPASAFYENSRIGLTDATSLGMGGAGIGLSRSSGNLLNPAGYAFSYGVDAFGGMGMFMKELNTDLDLYKNMYFGVTFPLKDWFTANVTVSRTSLLLPYAATNAIDESDPDDCVVDMAALSLTRKVNMGGFDLAFAFTGKYIMPSLEEEYQSSSAPENYVDSAMGGDVSLLAVVPVNESGSSFNLGLTLTDVIAPLDVTMGINAGLGLKMEHQLMGLASFSLGADYLMNHANSTALHVGAEEWFLNKKIAVRAGYLQNTFYTDRAALYEGALTDPIYDGEGQITAGLGFRFSGFEVNAGYALAGEYTGSSMAFSLAYTGEKTMASAYKIPPVVRIMAESEWLSPNGDGVKDQVRILAESKDNEIIKSWTLSLTDEGGKEVRRFKGKKSLPPFMTWDGKDNKGAVVPDGTYAAVMTVKDRYGNKGSSNKAFVTVRSKTLEVTLNVMPDKLIPGEGLTFTVTPHENVNVAKTQIVVTKKTETIHEIIYEGHKDRFEWSGILADGTYPEKGDSLNIFARLTDRAGNTGESLIVTVPVDATQLVEPSISQEMPPIPAMLLMARLRFGENAYTLTAAQKEELDKIISTLISYPQSTVRVEGHTDNVGARSVNEKLSRNRAEMVKKYLVAGGIDSARIVSVAYGPDMPVDTNKTAKGRANNRRVDVIMLSR